MNEQNDPAARFRTPARNTPPDAGQGGGLPAAEPPRTSSGVPGIVWFLLGVITGAGGWFGYGLMQASMVKSAAQAMAAAGTSGDLNAQMKEFMSQAQRSTEQMAAAANGSSLDLVTSPGSAPGAAANGPKIDPIQADSMNKAGADMIGALMPMMNNPTLLKNMPPDKRKQLETITAALMSMQATMATGKPIDKAQSDAMLKSLQELQGGMGLPGAGGRPASDGDRK